MKVTGIEQKMSAFEELRSRGLIEQATDEEAIKKKLDEGMVTFYVGFDPTAESLHIGSLLPIMAMAFLQKHGHKPVALVGGATGMIGDPSGRSSERELLTEEILQRNVNGIKNQLEQFMSFEGDNAAVMTNNFNWWGGLGFIECLRDIGKHFSVNNMMNKESVRRRLQDRDQGISYTEFSYQILQAYDFKVLYEEENCIMQCGGSDQWGNITAGIDLIRRILRAESYGLTFPLVMTSSGEKFGKSAGNAIWLDPKMTSPYQFYQYWMQTDDRDVEKLLKYFTFIEVAELEATCRQHEKEPHLRTAQKLLAAEVTRVVHGEKELQKVLQATQVLFGGEIVNLNDADLQEIFNDVPSIQTESARLQEGIPFLELLTEAGLCKSKGEARRLVSGGGGYINNEKIADIDYQVTSKDLASETVMILRTGKKKYHLVKFN
jgi:tyrosyl-tRNA synthetase